MLGHRQLGNSFGRFGDLIEFMGGRLWSFCCIFGPVLLSVAVTRCRIAKTVSAESYYAMCSEALSSETAWLLRTCENCELSSGEISKRAGRRASGGANGHERSRAIWRDRYLCIRSDSAGKH